MLIMIRDSIRRRREIDDGSDVGPEGEDVRIDSPRVTYPRRPVLRVLPPPLADGVDEWLLVVLPRELGDGIEHPTVAAVFVFHGDVVVGDVAVVVLDELGPAPAAPGFEILELVSVGSWVSATGLVAVGGIRTA